MRKLITLVVLGFCLSTSAQITWVGSNDIATNIYGNMHPRMSTDRQGNPLVVWGRMSDQSVLFSKWNGTMFTTPVKLNPSWLSVATASWMGSDIASHGDTVYVVVKRIPEASDTNRMFIFTSFDGGVSFKSPVEFGFIGDSISRFPTVTTDAGGNPIVAFMKFDPSLMDSRWVVSKSGDFGKTFTTDVKASGWGASAEVCDCCPGSIISSGNSCALLYRDNNKNIRDDWASISTDNATSFTSGFALENNKWMLMTCPSSGPDGVIISDTLYSTFMSGASGKYRIFLSKSSISSGVVSNVSNLMGTITGLSQQNYPRIARDGNALAIVWKQTVVGSLTQLPILFTNDITKGIPTTYDTVDLANITNADVAMSKGQLFVVWQDDGSGTIKYRKGTYNQSVTGLSSSSADNFRDEEKLHVNLFPNPCDNELNISLSTNVPFSVTIFNALGQKMYSTQVLGNCQVPVANYPSGLYFIQLNTGKNFITHKIIKQ